MNSDYTFQIQWSSLPALKSHITLPDGLKLPSLRWTHLSAGAKEVQALLSAHECRAKIACNARKGFSGSFTLSLPLSPSGWFWFRTELAVLIVLHACRAASKDPACTAFLGEIAAEVHGMMEKCIQHPEFEHRVA